MGGKRARRRQLISDRIALYKTEEDLGGWGAGNGRWVYDEQDKEHFVFVTLRPESVTNSRARRAFKRQLEHSQGLEHPRIVAILKGGTDDGDGRPYLIQEATSGRTLEKAIADGETFTPGGALQVAVDVLNGLAYAHSRGRIEGGLSPRSILISGEGDLARGRILTFGFPRVVGEEQETPVGTLCVDSEYASPEVIKSEPVDPRADVYSVGAILFRMLTGKPAIPTESSSDPVLHRLNQTADSLPEGTLDNAARDEALRVALRRSLSKAPSRRPTARGFALLLAGESDESERFSEVLPDGGECSASGAKIPPFAERPWDRKNSDRPFRCRASGATFAGQAQWDPRMLTSSKGADKSLPEPEGDPPADVALTHDAPSRKERDTAARMRAMQELITSSKEQRPTRNVDDDRDLGEDEDEGDARSSDVVRTALIDAWESDRRELKTARRMRADRHETETPAKQDPKPSKPSSPSAPESKPPVRESKPVLPPLPPISSRAEAARDPRPTTHPTGWALITLGLLLLALFLGITLSGERGARVGAERERDETQTSLAEATKAADANAAEAQELRSEVISLRGTIDAHQQVAEDAEAAYAKAETEKAKLQLSLDVVTGEAAAARLERDGALDVQRDAIASLTSEIQRVALLRKQLDEARASAIKPSELKALEDQLVAAQQREQERAQAAVALAGNLAVAEEKLTKAQAKEAELQARSAELTEQLTTARARREAVERELSELKLAQANTTPAAPAVAGSSVALTLATVNAQGTVQPTAAGTAVNLAPGSRAVLSGGLAELTPLLRAGETSSAVLALHVQLSGAGKAPRVFGQALTQAGALDGNSPRRYHRAAAESGDRLRYWITPAEARRYLKEGRASAFVLEAPFGGGGRQVLSAELVVTPVGGDAARLLKELRAREW